MDWNQYEPDPLRGAVRGAIEESSGQPLSVSDPLPDELIAAAQIEGISLESLRLWIYTDHPDGWSASAFIRWWHGIERVRRGFRELQEAAVNSQ